MNSKTIHLIYVFFLLLAACDNKVRAPLAISSDRVGPSRLTEKEQTAFVDSVLRRFSSDSANYRLYTAYLMQQYADPNSPLRNERIQAQLLEATLKSKWYGQEEKEMAQASLQLLRQNCVGCPANDFAYRTPMGEHKNLYSLVAKYTLLFFYNPDCEACKEMKESLLLSSTLRFFLQRHELKILAIYTDQDTKLWERHLAEQPAGWLQGRDENEFLYRNGVYDLKAIPTVYLLDQDKKVLLKDVVDIHLLESKLQLSAGALIQTTKHHE